MILAASTGGWPPPRTWVTGAADNAWYHVPLTITRTAAAVTPAASISSLSYAIDGQAPIVVAATTAAVSIWADTSGHTNDGQHIVIYFATDAHRGGRASLKYEVVDEAFDGGTAKVTIKVKNRAGKVVWTMRRVVKPVETPLIWKFTVPRTWRTGTYKFFGHVTDSAGNKQANAASNELIVK